MSIIRFFLVVFCFFALLANTLTAQYSEYQSRIIAIDTIHEKSEFYTSKTGTQGFFDQGEQLRQRFQKEVAQINADDTLNQQDKKYLSTLASYLAAKLLHLPKSTEAMKEKYCDEMETLVKSLEDDVEKWEDEKIKLRSDVYRLLGDLNIFYANRCIGALFSRMPRLVGSVKFFKKAIKIDPDNMLAHTSFGIYKNNAPRVGGGSVKEAIKQFSLVAEKGSELERYHAYCWLGIAFAKQDKSEEGKQKAFEQIAKAKEIYPSGGQAVYFRELIETGDIPPQ